MTYGGAMVYHNQQLRDINFDFTPENGLDDILETNIQTILLFPFQVKLIKNIYIYIYISFMYIIFFSI